jgi:hypothetical protein
LGSSRFARRYYGNPLFSSGYVRCFSSPGSLRRLRARSSVSRWGCPIRIPQDHRLPAPPLRVSSRGHVLHRPLAPRHPPCALLRLCLPTSSVSSLFVVRAVTSVVFDASSSTLAEQAAPLQFFKVHPSDHCDNAVVGHVCRSGAAGIRTPDLRRARAALSQTKLRPPSGSVTRPAHPAKGGRAWTRTRDLGLIRAAL